MYSYFLNYLSVLYVLKMFLQTLQSQKLIIYVLIQQLK